MLVVLDLDGGIDSQRNRDLISPAAGAVDEEGDILARLDLTFQTDNVKDFGAVELQRLSTGSFLKLARQNTHAYEIAAVNSFEALRNHSLHTQQTRTFRGPVTRGARAVLLAGDNHQLCSSRLIPDRRIIDAHLFSARLIKCDPTLNPWNHEILNSHIGKRPARHHAVIPAT